MIIYSLLAGAFLLLAYLITTSPRHYKPSLLLACVALCLCAATSSLGYLLASFGPPPTLMPLYRAAGTAMFFIPPLLLLLVALMVGNIGNRPVFVTILLSFGISVLLGGMQIFHPPPFTYTPFGDSPAPNIPAVAHQIHLILSALLSTGLAHGAYRKTGAEQSGTGRRSPYIKLITIVCAAIAVLAALGFIQQPQFTTVGGLVTLWFIIPIALAGEFFRHQQPATSVITSVTTQGVMGGLTATGLWAALWIFFHPVLRDEEQVALPAIASTGLLIAIVMESYPLLINCLKRPSQQPTVEKDSGIEEVAEYIAPHFANCNTPQQLHHLIKDLLARYIGVKNHALYLSSVFLWKQELWKQHLWQQGPEKQGQAFYHIDLLHDENMITETPLSNFSTEVLLSLFKGNELFDIQGLLTIPNHTTNLPSVSAAIPILFQGQPVGALLLGHYAQDHYSTEKRQLLREIGHHAGPVLAHLITQQTAAATQRLVMQHDELVDDVKRVIHDVKNPVSSILGIMELYAPSVQNAEAMVTEAVNDALHTLNQALELLNGKQKQETFLQLNNIVRRVAGRFILSTIKLELGNLPDFYGNEGKVESLLDNLLKNAIEAEGIRGHEQTVAVKTRFDASCHLIVCQISDQGGGIPTDILPTLWQGTITTKRYGSGIGLPLIKKIVAEHHGAITVDSVPGEGTTFTFSLPVAHQPTGRPVSALKTQTTVCAQFSSATGPMGGNTTP